jgi:hypothetical protein
MSHREESIQDFLSDASNNLFAVIDRDKVHGLNLSVPEDAKEVIKPWDERDSVERYCETGVDDEVSHKVHFVCQLRIEYFLNQGCIDIAHITCPFLSKCEGKEYFN